MAFLGNSWILNRHIHILSIWRFLIFGVGSGHGIARLGGGGGPLPISWMVSLQFFALAETILVSQVQNTVPLEPFWRRTPCACQGPCWHGGTPRSGHPAYWRWLPLTAWPWPAVSPPVATVCPQSHPGTERPNPPPSGKTKSCGRLAECIGFWQLLGASSWKSSTKRRSNGAG